MRANWNSIIFAILLAGFWSGITVEKASSAPARTKETTVALDNDPHLIGWWKFDDTTGKTASDSSKKNHNGVLEGDLSFNSHSAPGRVGAAVRLEGKGDGVTVAGFKGVTGSRPRTIAAWIKTSGRSGEIISWGRNDFGKMWTFGFIRSRIGVTPKGGYYYMNDPTNDDAWHHVAVVMEEANPPNLHDHVTLYKDGVVAEVHDIGLLDLWPIETGNELDVRIGRRFKGLIDDLRVYDRVLSEDEIGKLFRL